MLVDSQQVNFVNDVYVDGSLTVDGPINAGTIEGFCKTQQHRFDPFRGIPKQK